MILDNDRCLRRARRHWGLALLVSATACASASSTPSAPSAAAIDQATGVPVELSDASRPPDRPRPQLQQETESFQDPTGTLALPAALSAALRKSPRLESFDWRVRADESRALQAGLLPNPTLAVGGENFAGGGEFSGYDVGETTVFLGQLVELGGKRTKRRRLALLDRDLSSWDYEAARLDVLTETTQQYIAALAARDRLTLSNEILRISRESLEANRTKVHAGAASSIEEAQFEIAVSTLEMERELRSIEFEATKQVLASSWVGEVRFSALDGDLTARRELPPLERIKAAVSTNPDLARWASEIAQRDAAVELARAGTLPDVVAGLGVRHFNGPDEAALVFAVEVPLPLFDRNQGSRAAARSEANRSRALARDARVTLVRALIATHTNALIAQKSAENLEKQVLPQALTAYEKTHEAYQKGLFRLGDVFAAQRTLFATRTEYVDALERLHSATADLERLTGSSLEDL